ncbi:acyl-homoserine lactone acylase PvdQ [Halopolyspora algeriensis]|uniref:Acyl-homoserine lactone acylase PvdQ n=1 Tax=Halopolyspora algeriensis TaxID=1500506 RepID=A0A368VWJ9_9ACTN|nr:penicillin acylase family protein [Halopolyspora algeriensis]RCW45740.1 acyl-homoserine lactone acylase PvdQ [Halopolyspora algeriensis]TQM54124.1 acyl-homoserine lactone acylase PvdQ [Halopolyspora algeriensis]
MPRTVTVLALAAAWFSAPTAPAARSHAGEITTAATEVDGHYRDFGDPGGFVNIMPPGQDGTLNAPEALAARTGHYPPHVTDQLARYEELVHEQATPGFTDADLLEHFKDASFGAAPGDIARRYRPGGRDDVVVLRDASHGVPHIFGDTRQGTMFAAGYTAAEDRLFLMDVLRHLGRARLSEFLGPSAANLAMDRSQLAVAPYTEQDLRQQVERLRNRGPMGRRIHRDATAYSAGVNAYIREAIADPTKLPAEYPALQQVPEQWKLTDIVAIASLVGGIFGKGGGSELANYCNLRALSESTGSAEQARLTFDDLHFADDAEAPTTTQRRFPYMTAAGPTDPAATPRIDCGTLQPIAPGAPEPEDLVDAIVSAAPVPPAEGGDGAEAAETGWDPADSGRRAPAVIDGPLGTIRLPFQQAASNALLVSGKHTGSGNPIAVFGPQTGYFSPQLLVEKDIHGPGIDARGVAFAGTDLYVQMGRGTDYAWSATSAGADNVDTWTLELCEPGGGTPTVRSMGYRHHGRCLPIESFDHTVVAKPSAGGLPSIDTADEIVWNQEVQRTEHYGFLTARGKTTDGTPIAITSDRSTYRSEVTSTVGFSRVNDPQFMSGGTEAFREAMGTGIDYTFNWFYVDGDDIAYQHSCKCPDRADGIDPYLPVWGTGEFDHEGHLGFAEQPHAVNPPDGALISWNNKQAPGFAANDAEFAYGPVYRSDMLQQRLRAKLAEGPVDRGDLVDVMALAGTTDLRAQEIMPWLHRVMGRQAPDGVDPRTQDMWNRLRAWAADDLGHRRDHDADGSYEHAAAIAIMDAWWGGAPDATTDTETNPNASSQLIEAIFGKTFATLSIPIANSPLTHTGSAFNGGAGSHVVKDLRQVLNEPVRDRFQATYCGGGDLEACRHALWKSLSAVAGELEKDFGSPSVRGWRRVPADDAIVHSPLGLTSIPEIDWVNRPTFQQVVEVGAPVRQATRPGRQPTKTEKQEHRSGE